jgi:hypothetical protein
VVDLFVPTVDVGIFLDSGFALESFEADNICLRGAIAAARQSGANTNTTKKILCFPSQRSK